MKFMPSRKAREILGVHENTLRRWANEGKIRHIKTEAGQRLYDTDSFVGIHSAKRKVCYCRVSSHKQKDDLERQSAFMSGRCPGYEIITDIGSGLNFRRKGLLALLESVCGGDVSEVVVAHKDRLCRFGFDLVRWLIEYHGGKLVVLDNESQSPQSELVNDLLAIITVFSCRMHGLRKYRAEIKEDKTLSE
ncbi:MAG: DNA invertase [Desulfobacteraceae bacterium IS3]|nr:MAG: DNA invertase [Desulfobacteraceae bacterium IS3]